MGIIVDWVYIFEISWGYLENEVFIYNCLLIVEVKFEVKWEGLVFYLFIDLVNVFFYVEEDSLFILDMDYDLLLQDESGILLL